MAEIGQVMEKQGDLIKVKLQRHDACNHCNACTMGVDTEEMILEVENLCKAKAGDLVEIHLEESNFLQAVMIMYIVPLLGLLAGIAIGYGIGNAVGINSEVTALVIGFLLLAGTYLFIKSNEERFHTKKFRPVANHVVKREEN